MPHTPAPWVGRPPCWPCSCFCTCLTGCSGGRERSATGRAATSVATATPPEPTITPAHPPSARAVPPLRGQLRRLDPPTQLERRPKARISRSGHG